MEKQPRTHDLISLAYQPEKFIVGLPKEKLMLFKVQVLDLKENFNRNMSIVFINSNFTGNKHLSMTILNGMEDREIKQVLDEILIVIDNEIKNPSL